MSAEIDQLIQVARDVTSFGYYGLATDTIFFYDYLLTLGDEIKYFWRGKKTWTFWLFFVNRYFPMIFQFWLLGISYGANSPLSIKVCQRTAWYSIFTWTFCTLFAQVAVTIRVYAVTFGNIPITAGLAVMTATEFALGILQIVYAGKRGAVTFPQVSPNANHLCAFTPDRGILIGSVGLSLLYDFLALSIIVTSAVKSKTAIKVSNVLSTIAEDAMVYFFVIFGSHLGVLMTLLLGRESIQLIPGLGNVVYLPVMIGRIMLSLRKAAGSQRGNWSLAERSTLVPVLPVMKFQRPRRSLNARKDDVRLEVLSESQTAVE